MRRGSPGRRRMLKGRCAGELEWVIRKAREGAVRFEKASESDRNALSGRVKVPATMGEIVTCDWGEEGEGRNEGDDIRTREASFNEEKHWL